MDEKPEARPMGQMIQIDEARKDTRAGSYERSLETRAGQVSLKVPKLRRQTFETAIIERYRRRESSVEEALIEMYLAGVSVRRVEDITEALWGTRVSPSTVSNLNKKIYAKIEAWRNRPIEGEHPYVFLDGIVMKRTWAGEVRNVSLLVAIGVNAEGFREILGICEGTKEDKSGWSAFLRHLVDRGLKGVELITSDACRGLVESAAEFLPNARWQRCVVHFYRNVFSHVPAAKVREVSHMLKAIHAQETRATAEAKASAVVDELRRQRMGRAADLVDAHVAETLTYYAFPDCHWIKIRTTDVIDKTFVGFGGILFQRGRPRGEERRVGWKRCRAAYGDLAGLRRPRARSSAQIPAPVGGSRRRPPARVHAALALAGGDAEGQLPGSACGTIRLFGGRGRQAATKCSYPFSACSATRAS